jgi:hypothetical protein
MIATVQRHQKKGGALIKCPITTIARLLRFGSAFILGRRQMASIVETAKDFFTACETGKGWDGCKAFCKAGATFSAQAEPLADVKTLQQYCDWMKALYTPLPNASYDIKSFAVDMSAITSRLMQSFLPPTRGRVDHPVQLGSLHGPTMFM